MITFIMPLNKATFVPGFSGRYTSALYANGIFLGSATIIFAPLFFACFTKDPRTGCVSVVFDPVINITSASNNSVLLFVIAPLPSVVAKPATVDA